MATKLPDRHPGLATRSNPIAFKTTGLEAGSCTQPKVIRPTVLPNAHAQSPYASQNNVHESFGGRVTVPELNDHIGRVYDIARDLHHTHQSIGFADRQLLRRKRQLGCDIRDLSILIYVAAFALTIAGLVTLIGGISGDELSASRVVMGLVMLACAAGMVYGFKSISNNEFAAITRNKWMIATRQYTETRDDLVFCMINDRGEVDPQGHTVGCYVSETLEAELSGMATVTPPTSTSRGKKKKKKDKRVSEPPTYYSAGPAAPASLGPSAPPEDAPPAYEYAVAPQY